jgi:hypothetical protein
MSFLCGEDNGRSHPMGPHGNRNKTATNVITKEISKGGIEEMEKLLQYVKETKL